MIPTSRPNAYDNIFFTYEEVLTLMIGAQHLGKSQLKTLLYILQHMHPITRLVNCSAIKIAAKVGCVPVTVASALHTLIDLGLLVKEGIPTLYTVYLGENKALDKLQKDL